jgi:uncharacterized protein YicC (UPF0701 family)
MTLKEFKKLVKEVLDEASTTAGVPGYLTPKAFSKSGQSSNAAIDTAKDQGYMKAPETHKWFKKLYEAVQLSEITYKEYKKAPGMSSKHKLNNAIKECNRALFEIERYLKQNKKLREEEGLGLNEYWKSTAVKLVRMNERLKSLQREIKKFGLKEILSKIQEEKAEKDYDKDGKVETPEAEYKGSKDKAIKQAKKK